MSEFDTMDYILSIAVLCYGVYLTAQNLRLFLNNQKVRKEYLKTTKNDYVMVNQYMTFLLIFGAVAVIGIVAIFFAEKTTKNDIYTCVGLLAVSIVAAGMMFDTIVKRRVIVDKDGFVFEKAYYRFRSIVAINMAKSMFKNRDILTVDQQHVIVSRKMGELLEEKLKEWKNRKKKKNR